LKFAFNDSSKAVQAAVSELGVYMKKKLITAVLFVFCAVAFISAKPGPKPPAPRPDPASPHLLTPKRTPPPPAHHHIRPLPPPPHRHHYYRPRSVIVFRSTSRVYRDPPPVRRDLPLTKAPVEYEYVYDCDYDCPVQGTVKAVDPSSGTLVVDSDGETLIVAASASTKIFRDNDDPNVNNRTPRGVISIGIGDIRKGDFVGIQVTDTGDVTLGASIVHVFDLTR